MSRRTIVRPIVWAEFDAAYRICLGYRDVILFALQTPTTPAIDDQRRACIARLSEVATVFAHFMRTRPQGKPGYRNMRNLQEMLNDVQAQTEMVMAVINGQPQSEPTERTRNHG